MFNEPILGHICYEKSILTRSQLLIDNYSSMAFFLDKSKIDRKWKIDS